MMKIISPGLGWFSTLKQCHYLIYFHQEVKQINLSLIDKSDNTGLESFWPYTIILTLVLQTSVTVDNSPINYKTNVDRMLIFTLLIQSTLS